MFVACLGATVSSIDKFLNRNDFVNFENSFKIFKSAAFVFNGSFLPGNIYFLFVNLHKNKEVTVYKIKYLANSIYKDFRRSHPKKFL